MSHIPRATATARREAGFTLIEVLIVLVILAVLLATAFPAYMGFKTRAERRTAQANLRSAIPAVEGYFVQTGSYDGMDLTALKAINSSLGNNGTEGFFVVSAAGGDYCVRTAKGGATYYKNGPDGAITAAACT